MYSYEYKKDLSFGRVCLEVSLKPFQKLDLESIEKVCRHIFESWRALINKADSVAVMFWTSDGSEILDYDGDLDREFEWCKYIGIGNPVKNPEELGLDTRSLHVKPVLYMENPPVMRYRDLKNIVATLKRVGKEMCGKEIYVVETFDPGPEFAYSKFKFEKHTEICKGNLMGNVRNNSSKIWIHCAATLKADQTKYAAYPNGIPEGTLFGEFLGKQFLALKKDIGFDTLWLSNGFGFALEAWSWKGELFNGERFDHTNTDNVRKAIGEFWDSFSKETKDMVIETRGSNLSTAMDISAHGCPIDDIYKNNIIAPPNSPWAAIDSRFGLELVGFMSHIAKLPKNGYLFRYYTNDPWWKNSPWFDRYQGKPHDIYLPLSITRLDENGNVTKPAGVNFLSIDDSFGEIPDKCANEVTPHILEAFNSFPDSAGLLTWVYPFDYYCKKGLADGKIDKILIDDWFIESAIDMGLPLNTVISDENFAKADMKIFDRSILLFPVPDEGTLLEKTLFKALEYGHKVMLYGDTGSASEELRKLIGVTLGEPASGEFKLSSTVYQDTYEEGTVSDKLLHNALLSSGGICEIPDGSAEIVASVQSLSSGDERVYGTYRKKAINGELLWIRGSFPHKQHGTGNLPDQIPLKDYFAPAVLLRSSLSKFGFHISFDAFSPSDKLPLIMNAGYNNGYMFTGFAKDATILTRLSYPDGAPIITNCEALVENDTATYSIGKWLHEECRVFVKQQKKTKVCLKGDACVTMSADRRITLTGLSDATVTFLIPKNSTVKFVWSEEISDSTGWKDANVPMSYSPDGKKVTAKNISGILNIYWQNKDTEKKYRELNYIR